MDSYTIGQAATAAGVTPRAIRLYEARGLVGSAERTDSGYRLFTDDDIDMLTFIRQGRSLGLSLAAIAEIIDISNRQSPCERACALLAQRLAEVDAAIADLQRLRDTIRKARRLSPDRTPANRCAVIEHAARSN